MDANHNIASWIIAGGQELADPAEKRNLAHLRALKELRPLPVSIVTRLASAVSSLRTAPAAVVVNPACCAA